MGQKTHPRQNRRGCVFVWNEFCCDSNLAWETCQGFLFGGSDRRECTTPPSSNGGEIYKQYERQQSKGLTAQERNDKSVLLFIILKTTY